MIATLTQATKASLYIVLSKSLEHNTTSVVAVAVAVQNPDMNYLQT